MHSLSGCGWVKVMTDSRLVLAAAIVFATLVGAWMFRYETYGPINNLHRNRFTGTYCKIENECWFSSSYY